jgi:hypothetical protein
MRAGTIHIQSKLAAHTPTQVSDSEKSWAPRGHLRCGWLHISSKYVHTCAAVSASFDTLINAGLASSSAER